MIHFRPVIRVTCILLFILGGFKLLVLPVSWYHQSGDGWVFAVSALICFLFGSPLLVLKRGNDRNLKKREGYLIVSISWLALSTFGALPFLISGAIPGIPDALFETVSGITTTGASILSDIESMPKGILFWRSMIQWIGGMGIIVLTVAILPLLGIGGIELFVAEAPGPTSDKLHPRISETAKRLWFIYVFLTLVLFGLLWLAGMTPYDAINHSFTAMATGGYSTKNSSVALYSPLIQYILMVFMFIAGVNYTVLYFGFKRKFKKVWASDEFRAYLFMVIVLVAVVSLKVFQVENLSFEKAFRDSAFQVISLITTTGFVTADYTSWSNDLTMLFFILLFLGACAGSTAGGIKVIRNLVLVKNTYLEFKRILHPRAIVSLKINQVSVTGRVITHVIIFLLLYLLSFVIGSVILSVMGYDFLTSVGAAATSLGNVGPGIGKVGPVDNFGWMSGPAKILLSFLMLLGRLELFTILVLFTPFFWKSN